MTHYSRHKENEAFKILRRDYSNKAYQKIQLRIDQILGIKCVICGRTDTLICHEIHGKPHSFRRNYILSHPEDFARLCRRCHNHLHYLTTRTNISIDVLLVKLIHIATEN